MIDKEKGLAKLRSLKEKRALLLEEIDQTVRMLRSIGLDGRCEATWVEVAEALGVTAQAVQQRYSDLSWQGNDPSTTSVPTIGSIRRSRQR